MTNLEQALKTTRVSELKKIAVVAKAQARTERCSYQFPETAHSGNKEGWAFVTGHFASVAAVSGQTASGLAAPFDVNIKNLPAWLSKLPQKDEVDIEVASDGVTFKCGRSTLYFAAQGPAATPPAPSLEPVDFLSKGVVSKELREAFRTVAHAQAGKKEPRLDMRNVNVQLKDGALYVTAADGHRIAQVQLSQCPLWVTSGMNITFPPDAAKAVCKAKVGDAFELGEKTVRVGGVAFDLYEGAYLDIWRVLVEPEEPALTCEVDRLELIAALEAAASVSQSKAPSARLTFSEADLAVSLAPEESGAQFTERLPLSGWKGDSLLRKYQIHYLLAALKNSTGPGAVFKMWRGDGLSTLRITSEQRIFLVVGMRI